MCEVLTYKSVPDTVDVRQRCQATAHHVEAVTMTTSDVSVALTVRAVSKASSGVDTRRTGFYLQPRQATSINSLFLIRVDHFTVRITLATNGKSSAAVHKMNKRTVKARNNVKNRIKLKFHWDQFPRNFPVANVTVKSPTSYEEVTRKLATFRPSRHVQMVWRRRQLPRN